MEVKEVTNMVQYISIAKSGMLIIIILFIFVFFLRYSIKDKTVKMKLVARMKIQESMKRTHIDFLNYKRMDIYLSQYGIKFMFGDKIDPINYFGIKLASSFLFFIAGMKLGGFLLGTGLCFFGFIAFDFLIWLSNSQDNEKMDKDICSIYDTLRLQTKANVYLLQALGDCYLCVKTERLKAALLKLTSNIITNSEIDVAIDEFNLQFKNNYIDSFCIIIKQSLESGKSVQILEDMSNQLIDVQKAINMKERAALERIIQLFQLLFFVGMIGICLFYLCLEIGNGIASY